MALVAAVLLPGLLGFLIARPILRLSGHNLALGTLALGAVFFVVAAQWRSVTGGLDPGIVDPAEVWRSRVFSHERILYILAGISLLSAIAVAASRS